MPDGIYRTHSGEETVALGEKLAARFPPGSVVLLIGNLGAGKTTLAKGIAKGLGAAEPEEVTSPTYTLIHEFGDPVRLYHVDLYRLDEARQAASLGLEELFDSGAVVLIEWGERFREQMPESCIEVRLRRLGDEEREIEVTGIPG